MMMVKERPAAEGEHPGDDWTRTLGEADCARIVRLRDELTPQLRRMIERRIFPSLRRRIEVEDVLSGAFIRLQRSFAAGVPDSDETCRAWIVRSVLNEWHDQKRRHDEAKCRSVRGEEPLPDGPAKGFLDGIGVATALGIKEAIERIHEAIKPAEFEIVHLHAVDELTFAEIGAIIGKKEDTVRRCYARALEKIRKAVACPLPSK